MFNELAEDKETGVFLAKQLNKFIDLKDIAKTKWYNYSYVVIMVRMLVLSWDDKFNSIIPITKYDRFFTMKQLRRLAKDIIALVIVINSIFTQLIMTNIIYRMDIIIRPVLLSSYSPRFWWPILFLFSFE